MRALEVQPRGLLWMPQGRADGLDRAALRRIARSGRWIRLRTGVLCDGDLWHCLDADPTSRHALEAQAARLCIRRQSWAGPYVVLRWDHDDLIRRAAATNQRILRAFRRAELLRQPIQPAS